MNFPQRPASLLRARLRHELRAYGALYLAWLIWFAAFVLLVRSTLGGPDGNRYMSYLRSLVFDHDLLLVNELEQFGQRVIITGAGYAAQVANVGVIPFWLPFYWMALVMGSLDGSVGDGLGVEYQLWLDFGDWLYGLLAMIVMHRWARTRFSRAVSLAATLLVCLGSSFVYYMTALAPSYHMIAALLGALFFYLWDGTRASARSLARWFGLSLLAGLLMSMAQYHAVLLVFLALDAPWLVARLKTVEGRRTGTKRLLLVPMAVAFGLFIPLIPQSIAWGIIFGNPFANPYTIEANWSGAHLLDVLFSSYHGLYFTAPLLLIATLGWVAGFRYDRVLYAGAFVALLGIAYSSSTRIGWWAGVSFGMRYFIWLTPLFVMGLASLMANPEARAPTALSPLSSARRLSVAALGVLAALWTYGYFLQAFTNLTTFSEYHPAQQWISNQALIWQNLREALAAHWLIPRSAALTNHLLPLALVSLVAARLITPRLRAGRAGIGWRWSVLLALAPILFGALLLSTIPDGETHKQALRASGYYEKNLARGELDWEQFSNEYVERSRYYASRGQAETARDALQRAIALWHNPSRRLVAENDAATYRPVHRKFGDAIELVGYRIEPPEIQPGRPLTIELLWRADRQLPEDYDAGVLLLDMGGQVTTRTPPARGADPFPATWWLPGVLIADAHTLDVDGIPPATLLKVRVELFDARAKKRLPAADNGLIAEVKRAPQDTATTKPIATLGGQVALLGHAFTNEADGARLSLTWRAEGAIDRDYTVFAHLLDAQNRIIAQSDAQPRGGHYPTHAWSRGEVVGDQHRFNLDATALARVERIAVGMYTLSDGKRLPSSTGGDAIVLPK